MKQPAAAALNARIALNLKLHKRQKEGTETSCCKAVNCLLVSYAMNDLIAETDASIIRFTHLLNKSPM